MRTLFQEDHLICKFDEENKIFYHILKFFITYGVVQQRVDYLGIRC
jgi:hypothetical protein